MNAPPAHVYEFGDFRLDVAKRVLWRGSEQVPLTSRVFETLLFLVEHHDTVLDKERLMEAIWPDSIVEENNLTQNISTLRRVFGEAPGANRFIVTIPGRGYRFVADVRSSENGAEPAEKSFSVASDEAMRPSVAIDSRRSTRSTATGKTKLVRIALALLLIGALITAGVFTFQIHKKPQPATSTATSSLPAPAATISGKSIAVLPFENLSSDPENAYFAAGIQDDVLASLAQIHDLKVISRTSVMPYQTPHGHSMREIAQALGVANVLEGSVRRIGNRVLVNVQLIDARNDRHLWAERYDRTIADSIGLQGELATQIAAALKTTLAPEEMARFAAKPTANSEAYVLYLTALGKETTDWSAAEQLYVQATTVDPTFALAYARASLLNSSISSKNNGVDQERKEKARAQAEEALRLSPTLGEAHTALGLCLYWGEKKYNAALKEFEVAAQISPNNAKIYDYVGGIYRRQGRWREAVASYERALFLDPRNASIANFAGNNHLFVRDWPAAATCYNHALEIKPDHVRARIGLAYLEVFRNANPAAGRRILQNIPAKLDSNGDVALARWDLAMLERDCAGAEKILGNIPDGEFSYDEKRPRAFFQGQTALACGDAASAKRYFAAAAPTMEEWIRGNPDDPERHSLLGLDYAYMQRKDDAIREGRRAVEMEPESQNAFHGADAEAHLALVYALVGEQNQAITLIEHLLSIPGLASGGPPGPETMTLAELRLRWEWDSLRSNPRFQKILAGPEPKTIY